MKKFINLGKLDLSIEFIMLFAVLFVFDSGFSLVLLAITVLLHEAGHLFGIYMMRGSLKKVELGVFGAVIKLNPGCGVSYTGEVIISLAGPALNLYLSFMLSLAGKLTGNFDWLFMFAGLNIIIGLFNLLPARQLDGGRALYYFLCMFLPLHTADFILKILTVITVCVMFFAGFVLFIDSQYNISLIIAGIYILLCSFKPSLH